MTVFAALQPSFDAVTPPATPGETGTVIDLGIVQTGFLLYATVAGTDSDLAEVVFNGSVDGTVWYPMTAVTEVRGGHASFPALNVAAAARYVSATAYTYEGSPVLTASAASVAG